MLNTDWTINCRMRVIHVCIDEGGMEIIKKYKRHYRSRSEVIRAALRALDTLAEEGRLPKKEYTVRSVGSGE